jgi:hypothetical protein
MAGPPLSIRRSVDNGLSLVLPRISDSLLCSIRHKKSVKKRLSVFLCLAHPIDLPRAIDYASGNAHKELRIDKSNIRPSLAGLAGSRMEEIPQVTMTHRPCKLIPHACVLRNVCSISPRLHARLTCRLGSTTPTKFTCCLLAEVNKASYPFPGPVNFCCLSTYLRHTQARLYV